MEKINSEASNTVTVFLTLLMIRIRCQRMTLGMLQFKTLSIGGWTGFAHRSMED